jgi:hypothetical protein
MPFRRLSCRAALVVIPLVFASGCATDPKAQLDAATNAAITTSVRSLPAVTGATTTETTSPTDTVSISLTTALDGSSAEDVTSATELVRDAANMVYATRHDTVDAVAISVFGVNSVEGSDQPTSLLAQHTFASAELGPANP